MPVKNDTDKLVLEIYRANTMKGNVVKLSNEAVEALKQWQLATGLPLKELASRFILFASERVEVAQR